MSVESLFFSVIEKDESSIKAWELFGDFIKENIKEMSKDGLVEVVIKAVNSPLNLRKRG